MARLAVLDVRFTGPLPTSVLYSHKPAAPGHPPHHDDVELADNSAQRAIANAAAGTHQLNWKWD